MEWPFLTLTPLLHPLKPPFEPVMALFLVVLALFLIVLYCSWRFVDCFSLFAHCLWRCLAVDHGLTMGCPWMTVVACGIDHGVERVLTMV